MTIDQKYIFFEGLKAGVSVKADAAFFDSLPTILSHWPYEVVAQSGRETFASVELKDNRYRLSSPFMEKTEAYRDPLNTICAIVAELAWLRLREDPSLLCLHGAAAEYAGRLVVFPATRRAGKSTLSVALTAAGVRMFTDDFLPISIDDKGIISGISSGVSPRLRLPMPGQIGPRAKDYLTRRKTLSNRQYTYVAPLKTENAHFGEAAPIGAVVFLDRQDDATPALTEISKAEALKILIKQNFSRAGKADDILEMLAFLARNLPVYLLRYNEAEPAIDILAHKFTGWADTPLSPYHPSGELGNDIKDGLRKFTVYRDVSVGQFEQAEGVRVVASDGQRFLTGRNGQSIHYLNEGAAMIWQILSEPASVDETVEILLAAFPEQERAQIEQDVRRSFLAFAKNGLLHKLDTAGPAGQAAAEMVAE